MLPIQPMLDYWGVAPDEVGGFPLARTEVVPVGGIGIWDGVAYVRYTQALMDRAHWRPRERSEPAIGEMALWNGSRWEPNPPQLCQVASLVTTMPPKSEWRELPDGSYAVDVELDMDLKDMFQFPVPTEIPITGDAPIDQRRREEGEET